MAANISWLDISEYPFEAHYLDIDGHRLHYIDEGQGQTLLFVHGTPSWSFDYRNVIKNLRGSYRCLALDHIGFGLSDKPADYDYSTQKHALTLERFVLEKQLKDITLVVHDFGGPIGFDFALRNPQRVKSIVVLNSWLWSSEGEPDFIRLKRILKSPFLPFLYRYLNFSPRFILPGSFGDHKLPKRILKQYTRPFADRTQRYGALAFAKALLNDQAWFEQLWNRRQALTDKPLLLLWGMKDPVLKPRYLHKFQSGFPHARTVELPTCGHFPQEEQPEAVSKALLDFLQNRL